MTTLTIRNVPAEVHRALQMRAAAHGHSIFEIDSTPAEPMGFE